MVLNVSLQDLVHGGGSYPDMFLLESRVRQMEQYILPEQLVRDAATHHVFLECDLVNGAFKRNRQVRQRTLVYVSAAGKRKENTI